MFRYPPHHFRANLFRHLACLGQSGRARKHHSHDVAHQSANGVLGVKTMPGHHFVHRQRNHRFDFATACIWPLKRVTQTNRSSDDIAHFFIPLSLTRPPPTLSMIRSGDPDLFRLTTGFADVIFGPRVDFGFLRMFESFQFLGRQLQFLAYLFSVTHRHEYNR